MDDAQAMSEALQQMDRRNMTSWPSSRLLDFAEAHPHDLDLLEFIHGELCRRDVAIAASAARRVAEMMERLRGGGGRANGHAPAAAESGHDNGALAEALVRIAALQARLEAAERLLREAEARASAAERALASEALPSRGGSLLRRVHLAETAPNWLVEAARRAFRLRFHPDRFTDPAMKARAEETFKEAEEIFRQISTTSH
jgi:hypothetical protein